MQENFASRISDWRNDNEQVQPGSFETPTKDSKPKPKNAFTKFNELADSNRFKIFETQETERKKLSKSLSEKTKEKKNIEERWKDLIRQVEQERRKIKQAEEEKKTLEARRQERKLGYLRNVPVMKAVKINRLAKKEKDMKAFKAYTRARNERNEAAKRQFKAEKEIELKKLAADIALVKKVIAEANQNCKEYETKLEEVQRSAGEMQTEINEIRKSLSFI
jgi:DNA repair exonuclease SbcCD ATPase subunit